MCALCEYVLEQIEEKLADNASEGKVLDLIDEACDFLPLFSDQCKALAEIYGPQIIKMLEANLDPKVVCNALALCTGLKRELPQFCSAEKEIGLCRAAMPSFYFDSATGSCNEFTYGGCGGNDNRFDSAYECTKTCGKPGFQLSKCDDCKLAIAYLDSFLSDHANEEEIRKKLDDFCQQVPGGFAAQCQALVDTYADEILKYAANIMDPLFVCEKIRLCDVAITPTIKPVRPKLVGANKCTYGPSYWCASRENAESCGATDHCLKNGGFK
jgi:saposin